MKHLQHSHLGALMFAIFACLVAIPQAKCSAAEDIHQKITDAGTAFEQAKTAEDYLRVAGVYQTVLDSGFVNGAILYNQGNSFLRAGAKGRAIAAYRQALRYRPRDSQIVESLNYALGKNASQPDSVVSTSPLFFWQDWLSQYEKLHAMYVTGVFSFVTASIWLYFRKLTILRALSVFGAIFALFFAVSAWYDGTRFAARSFGVVVAKEAVARKGNSDSYDAAFQYPLAEGTEFQVLETRPNWLRVKLSESSEAWIPQSAVVTY